MRRSYKVRNVPLYDDYVFFYPLENNGENIATSSYARHFLKFQSYGSDTTTPSFNDNLVFSEYQGLKCVSVTGTINKLVAKIDGVNLNEILNNNDFELHIEFAYRGGFKEVDAILGALRNSENTKSNGIAIVAGNANREKNYIQWIDEVQTQSSSYARLSTGVWYSIDIVKKGSGLNVVFTRMSDGAIIINSAILWAPIIGKPLTDSICVLGDYFPNANFSHNIRYINGVARNLYLKLI